MACGSCGGGAGSRPAETWIYQAPNGQKTETASQTEANQLVTINGGGQVYRKPQ
jgi:hypothetical protein